MLIADIDVGRLLAALAIARDCIDHHRFQQAGEMVDALQTHMWGCVLEIDRANAWTPVPAAAVEGGHHGNS